MIDIFELLVVDHFQMVDVAHSLLVVQDKAEFATLWLLFHVELNITNYKLPYIGVWKQSLPCYKPTYFLIGW